MATIRLTNFQTGDRHIRIPGCRFTVVMLSVLLSPLFGLAQQSDPAHLVDHKPLMNAVWETFDQLMYRVTHKNGQTVYTPHFPERLARLNGKRLP